LADIYDVETYEPRKSVGYLLTKVKSEMLAAVDRDLAADEQLRHLEVTSAQYVILVTLSSGGGLQSASDLCKGMSYDAGAMTRMIDRLEEKGLLRRRRCSDDRRLVYLELTEQGSAALPRMKRLGVGVANRFLQGFTKEEALQLEGYLMRMLENGARGANS
jgi:DNA-binding MarR family transcriptional regulator